jgi:hypothetical protein
MLWVVFWKYLPLDRIVSDQKGRDMKNDRIRSVETRSPQWALTVSGERRAGSGEYRVASTGPAGKCPRTMRGRGVSTNDYQNYCNTLYYY